MNTKTVLILVVVGLGAYFLFVKKPATYTGQLPAGVSTQQGGKSETTEVLEGTAGVIDAVGTAGGDIISSIWPD